MIERYLRQVLSLSGQCRLVEIEKEGPARPRSCCEARYFNLIDERKNLVAGFDAWMAGESFFGYFKYTPEGNLVERKTYPIDSWRF